MPNANSDLVVMWPQPQHSYFCITMGSNLSNAWHKFWISHSELETKKFAFSMGLKNLNLSVPYVWVYTLLNSLVGMVSGIFSCMHMGIEYLRVSASPVFYSTMTDGSHRSSVIASIVQMFVSLYGGLNSATNICLGSCFTSLINTINCSLEND